MHRPSSVAAALLVVLAAVTAGCGGDDATDTTATRPSTVTTEVPATDPDAGEIPAELVGVRWILDGTFTVAGRQRLPAPTEAGFTISADGSMAIDTGCNMGSATVTVDGGVLTVGPITVTERACIDEDATAIEQTLLDQLAEPQSWHVDGAAMTMFATNISDTGMAFRDGAVPPPTDPAPSSTDA